MIYQTLSDNQIIRNHVTPNFDFEFDICVIGLGTAGAISAISAGEQGYSVLGIDRACAPGGVAVCGGVCSYYFGSPGGRFEKIHQDCTNLMGKDFAFTDEYVFEKRSHSTAVKCHCLEADLENANVKVYCESCVIGVYMEENKVCGIRFFDGKKEYSVKAKVVIDGADGFTARLAGAKFRPKRISDGISMPTSIFETIYKNGVTSSVWGKSKLTDGLNFEGISKHLLNTYSIPPYLKSDSSTTVIDVGTMLGRRECFCIDSEENMSLGDYFNGIYTKEPMFYAFSCTDNSAHDMVAEDRNLSDWMFLAGIEGHGFSIPVPYRAMLPKGIENLIVTGKAIGSGHEAMSCVRMKADMEKCGEAAGILATLSVKMGISPKLVPYRELEKILKSDGCLDNTYDVGFADLRIRTEKLWQPVQLPKTTLELESAFASPHPECGLAAAVYRKVPTSAFIPLLSSKNKTVVYHAAIALGIRDEKICIPYLFEILSLHPSWQISHTNAKTFSWLCTSAHCNYLKAVMLLTRFGCIEALPIFEKDLARLPEILPREVEFSPKTANTEAMFRRFLTYSIDKLKKIQ